jgi:hypothetical protein
MIPFERVAECIRKLQAVIDVESDTNKKRLFTEILAGLKLEYEAIVRDNVPCPPEMEENVDKSLKLIEDMYDKLACN